MTDIEKTEAEIKVLQKKLELLKEIENHRSPVEKAYRDAYGHYPKTSGFAMSDWDAFRKGYEEGQKLKEFQPKPQTPEQVAEGLRDAMRQAKEDGVFDNPKPRSPLDEIVERLVKEHQAQKLWNIMRDKLGFSIDMCDEIVDAVEEWLPNEQSYEGTQNMDTVLQVEGFNDCLSKIQGMLR